MDCQRVLSLMDGYHDHELDLTTQLAVEQHLANCPACHAISQRQQALSAALAAQARYHRAPPALAAGVQSALDKIDAASGTNLRQIPRWLSLAASVAFAALVGSGVTYWLTGSSQEELLTQEVIASHVRAQMVAGRLTDVSSSDSHTVKPWFNGKLDFAPPVLDLTTQGFALVGGRLEYLANRPVAALVYRHRQHLIHLYVWPATDRPNIAPHALTRQGYQVIYWSDATMHYWAISDLNADALTSFSQRIQEQTTAEPTTRRLPTPEDLR
ncbi:MAG: zinc-finger family protein [Proteobacteria bacterium]|nr:zinc-finger family protein [Pseudomonadota bacterium]